MKRKIKRCWRHFKYWLARRMFPDNELNFLIVPEQADIQIKQITAKLEKEKSIHGFLGEDRLKEKLIDEMRNTLKQHIEYSEEWHGDRCTASGILYIVKERD